MPLYEYRCPGCGHKFEVLQRLGQGAAGLVCPACGRGEVERECSTFASGGSSSPAGGGGCPPGGRFT